MFWADKILENRKGKERVNDSFTPSGIVHMGSLKGPVIHDVLFKLLKEKGNEVNYSYGFDDFDPIDGLPDKLQEKMNKYMGIPIYKAPSPDGNGTFGEYYSNMMGKLLIALGVEGEIYRTSEMYNGGKFDEAIKFVLDNTEKIRKVYSEMYGKEIPSDWYPFQVVCPDCGKLGTSKVTGWDGEKVSYECSKTLVKWAEGCGEVGKISPYKGNGKMPWKVEWAAKWWTFKVTIEGAGKDHASAGGSYDVARKIIKDVFEMEPPLRLPYEFFLSDGKKMSSSKGLGLTGGELLEVLPPQLVRFLMIKTEPNTAVEFNPYGTQIIPKLYEDYEKAAIEYGKNPDSDLARAFKLSQIGESLIPKTRFLTLSQWVQMPNMEDEIKKEGLEFWAKYAKVWIEKYAPEKDKFTIQKELPSEVSNLTTSQKEYLKKLGEGFDANKTAEELQTIVYDLSKELKLSSSEAFKAIYTAFLGKDHGPKAAWLLQSVDPNFVKERLSQSSN